MIKITSKFEVITQLGQVVLELVSKTKEKKTEALNISKIQITNDSIVDWYQIIN